MHAGLAGHRRRARASHPDVRHRQPRLRGDVARRAAHRARSRPSSPISTRRPTSSTSSPTRLAASCTSTPSRWVSSPRSGAEAARVAAARSSCAATADFGALAEATGRNVVPFSGDRRRRRYGPARAPAALQRHHLHVLLRRHDRHRQGHHASGLRFPDRARATRQAMWQYTADDVVYATSKKYFTHGVWPGLFIPLSHGATAVITREPPRPDVVLDALGRYKVTKWVTVPTVIKNVLEVLRGMKDAADVFRHSASRSRRRRRSRRRCSRNSHDRFGIEMHDSIGSSEIAYEWIANGPSDFRRGSLGRPVFGCEVQADRRRGPRDPYAERRRRMLHQVAARRASSTGASTTRAARRSSATGRAPATASLSTRTAISGSPVATTTCSR